MYDIIVTNPPYQAAQKTKGKKGGGATLWDKFVNKSIDLTNQAGHICIVHPCGWRNGFGEYAKLGNRIKSLQLEYLEIHDSNDGLKTFGAGTSYDWYILKNCPNSHPTTIKCQDGATEVISVKDIPFIPSGMFEKIFSLLAKDDEERVEVLYSYSAYESRKPWMQKKKDKTYIHPVIHNVKISGELSFIYSSTRDKGHFGVPKVVFGKRQCGTFVDLNGEYGLSQHTVAITEAPNNLKKLNSAMNNPQFIELCKYISLNSTAKDKYDHRIISLFRKDFWVAFS